MLLLFSYLYYDYNYFKFIKGSCLPQSYLHPLSFGSMLGQLLDARAKVGS